MPLPTERAATYFWKNFYPEHVKRGCNTTAPRLISVCKSCRTRIHGNRWTGPGGPHVWPPRSPAFRNTSSLPVMMHEGLSALEKISDTRWTLMANHEWYCFQMDHESIRKEKRVVLKIRMFVPKRCRGWRKPCNNDIHNMQAYALPRLVGWSNQEERNKGMQYAWGCEEKAKENRLGQLVVNCGIKLKWVIK
jgi:hypothetical protein